MKSDLLIRTIKWNRITGSEFKQRLSIDETICSTKSY